MTLAIITARGGSKGLPRKNVLELHGKPLVVWTIEAALRAKEIKQTVVTTDDAEIAQTARNAGAQVIDRPARLASDSARSQDALAHALHTLNAIAHHEEFLLLQPTSPLRDAQHIDALILQARAQQAGSALSVTAAAHHPWKMLITDANGHLRPCLTADKLSAPRQSLPPAFRQNGAMYWGRIDTFLRTNELHIDPVLGFEMSAQSSHDIDTHLDLQACERLLRAS